MKSFVSIGSFKTFYLQIIHTNIKSNIELMMVNNMNLELSRQNTNLFFNNLIENGEVSLNNNTVTFSQLLKDNKSLEDVDVYNVALIVFNKAIELPETDPKKMGMLVRAHEILTKKSSFLPSALTTVLSYLPGTQYNVDSIALQKSESYFHDHFRDFVATKVKVIENHSKFEDNFTSNIDRIEKVVSHFGLENEWTNLKYSMEKGNPEEIQGRWNDLLAKIKENKPTVFKSNADVEAFLFKQRSINSYVTPKTPAEARFLTILSVLPPNSEYLEQELDLLEGKGLAKLNEFIHKFSPVLVKPNSMNEEGFRGSRLAEDSVQNIHNITDLRSFLIPVNSELHFDGLFKQNEIINAVKDFQDDFEFEQLDEESNPNEGNASNSTVNYERVVENPFEFEDTFSEGPRSKKLPVFTSETIELDYDNFIRGSLPPQQEGSIHHIALAGQHYLSGVSPSDPKAVIEYFKDLKKENVSTIIQLSKPDFIPATKENPIKLNNQASIKLVDEKVTKSLEHPNILIKKSTIEVSIDGDVRKYDVLLLQDNNEAVNMLDDSLYPEQVINDSWSFIQDDVILSENKPLELGENLAIPKDTTEHLSSPPLTMDLPAGKTIQIEDEVNSFTGSYGRISSNKLDVLNNEMLKYKQVNKTIIVNDSSEQENSSALILNHQLRNYSKSGFRPEKTLREYKEFSHLLQDKEYFRKIMTDAYFNQKV